MTNDPTDDMLSGWLPLYEAIEQAAAAWDCELERAWDRLRRWMRGGAITSKTRVDDGSPSRSRFSYEQISPDTWADPEDDRDGKHGPWHSIRTPIFINKDELKQLLRRVETGIQKEVEGADQAILLRIYGEISEPSSKVPISPLADALQEPHRSTFEAAFIKAIQASLFDDIALEYLCQGKWSSLHSNSAKTVVEIFGDAIFVKRYVLMAAMPLQALVLWAKQFGVPLPERLKIIFETNHPTLDNEITAADDEQQALHSWRMPPGKKASYDWPGMYRHLLLACGKHNTLDRPKAHEIAAEFFGARDKYPSHLADKIRDLFKEVTKTKSLRDVLAAHLGKAED